MAVECFFFVFVLCSRYNWFDESFVDLGGFVVAIWKRRNRVKDKRKRPRSSLEFKYGSLFKVSDIEPVFDKKQDKYGHLQMSATWLPAGGSMSVSVVPVSYEAVFKRNSIFDTVQYRIEIRRDSEVLTRMIRVDIVDSMLFEPLSHLKWKPSSKRSRYSYTDGDIWGFSFSYRDTCISLGGHCFYPDKYHVVWNGIVRVLLYLVTYDFQPMNKNLFDDTWYSSWVLACEYARADAWKDI